ncbi:MAG: O-antigen ligase family protein, partial [Hymenobacteraceae bacterium]|nr:O-antigen ligase family protein [Hymenobacteraceae bacterium]
VYTYKTALLAAKENWLIGTGIADVQDEIHKQYAAHFPEIDEDHYMMPHNQYLYYLVAFGLVGFVFFMLCFYYPFFQSIPFREPLLLSHYLFVSLSFLVEPTLETQLGITYSLIFLLLPVFYLKQLDRSKSYLYKVRGV